MQSLLGALANELVTQGINIAASALESAINSGSFSDSTPHDGARWITCVDGSLGQHNGLVMSAYYHPTKQHSVTTIGKLGTKKSFAAAGKWAVSYQTKAMSGNKALYNTEGTNGWVGP